VFATPDLLVGEHDLADRQAGFSSVRKQFGTVRNGYGTSVESSTIRFSPASNSSRTNPPPTE
jgi:hypothetical protein